MTKKIKQFKMIQIKKQEVKNFLTVPLYMYVAYMENYMLKVSKILQLRKRFFFKPPAYAGGRNK